MLKNTIFALTLALAAPANAAVVVNIYESGGDVISEYSGTIDLGGVSFSSSIGTGTDELRPVYPAYYSLGGAYGGFFALTSGANWIDLVAFNTIIPASSSTGNLFGFRGDIPLVYLESGYTSGALISGSMTFAGTTLAALGMNEGVYNNLMTWGGSIYADSISMNISTAGPSSVPLPAGLPLLVAGLGMLGFTRRGKKQR